MSSTETLTKHRLLGFLIWQTISSTSLFLLFKPLTFPQITKNPLILFAQFLTFTSSQLLFAFFLASASSPHPVRPASPVHLFFRFARFESPLLTPELRPRFRALLGLVLVIGVSIFIGAVSVWALCWEGDTRVLWRGLVVGGVYAGVYLWKERWVLRFPIVQRPPSYRFVMGLPSAVIQGLQLSSIASFSSAILLVFIPDQHRSCISMGKLIMQQIIFYIGSFAVLLCWEITQLIHQVLHTKRFMFAPPKGSAAAETNPSEPLLAALEESSPRSLLQYLAYLDICMVCENNVDTWRRAAFFEETGETYKRVIAACLRPLEELASKLGEGLESSVDKLSDQLQLPTEPQIEPKYYQPLNDFQLLAWCARTTASLTAHSHKEDRFGVAQLSGSNSAVISTLISCLLAVETLIGKKTNLQSPNQLIGGAGIRWAALSPSRRDTAVGTMGRKKGGPIYSRAYTMADVLRTSIYLIVNAFHDEMMSSAKANHLEMDWIISGKPLYGTRELLLYKLRLFLDFQAC